MLEEHLHYIGCENQCIHAVPIIRGEHQYKYYQPETRRNLLKDMMYFIRHVDINVDKMGVKVIAPSDTVWAHSDGKLTIGPKSYINNGKWVEFNPRKRGKG